ncbi:MAG: TonB-dependent receptor, partial [Candidatus Latescibacterota bacterium]
MPRQSSRIRIRAGAIAALLLTSLSLAASSVRAGDKPDVDYAEMTLEQLMAIPVHAASKRDQKATEAPSSVTLITSQDIRTYGWRTLGDLLRSTPGFYVSNPRTYGFLGVRGFGRPGDFGGRILVLVNGHRLNDPLYDTAAIVDDFILDMDLIDRVEVVRGPGSALYGNNAFFAIVNIIMKRGDQIQGIEASGESATYDSYRGRLTLGVNAEGGTEALLSASGYTSQGNPEVYYPEFGTSLRDGDGESAHRFGVSLGRGGFTLEAFYVGRDKDAPPGYGTTPALPRHTFDGRAYAEGRYERRLTETETLMARAYYDWYEYLGKYTYDLAEPGEPAVLSINRDESIAESVGGEVQFNWRLHRQHSATLGADYRNDFRQMMKNFDEEPRVDYLDIDPQTRIVGLFV